MSSEAEEREPESDVPTGNEEIRRLVEALYRKVKTQDETIEAQKETIADHRERIEALEQNDSNSRTESEGTTDDSYDRYDQAIIDALEPGRVVNLGELKQLYRAETTIRAPATIKNRIKLLTAGSEFHQVNVGTWMYEPETDSDDEGDGDDE